MSTSWLYHGFGIRGYQYWKTEYVGGEMVVWVTQKLNTCRCSACGCAEVAPRGQVVRRFRTLPTGSKQVTVVLPTGKGAGSGRPSLRTAAEAPGQP